MCTKYNDSLRNHVYIIHRVAQCEHLRFQSKRIWQEQNQKQEIFGLPIVTELISAFTFLLYRVTV